MDKDVLQCWTTLLYVAMELEMMSTATAVIREMHLPLARFCVKLKVGLIFVLQNRCVVLTTGLLAMDAHDFVLDLLGLVLEFFLKFSAKAAYIMCR